ncbi:WXG100 family type VII secretion target [Actinoplanes sp. NPDC051494]|uniref:WXG100 family type VII secretion target n=1 Tax=Actinoplanes sp. NPDC051494 TaxID=3363907 RepID=UPI00379FF34A
MSDIDVSPPALRTFADNAWDRNDELYRVSTSMYVVDLAPDTFGWIPGIGQRIFDSYSEFVAGLHEAITSTADTMSELATAVRATATGYEETDRAQAEMFGEIEFGK